MGKKGQKKSAKAEQLPDAAKSSIFGQNADIDPTLASLFATGSQRPKSVAKSRIPARKQLAPDKPPNERNRRQAQIQIRADGAHTDTDTSEADSEEDAAAKKTLFEVKDVPLPVIPNDGSGSRSRKRKNRDEDENLEAAYWNRLAREDAKEEARARNTDVATKRKKLSLDAEAQDDEEQGEEGEEAKDESDEPFETPQHESLQKSDEFQEVDKSKRTVFLGNVSTEAISSKVAKKTLLRHMSSFLSGLPAHKPPHKIESIRFRSTPFSTTVPKKAAFVKKDIMEATTKSTNAYIVYSTQQAAAAAAKRLNGTVVLDRHLRVDSVAHPQKVDHKRCVFVGNLGFVDDESSKNPDEDEEEKKKKAPGDVEEGLWRQFNKAGTVESVRVIRDPRTRVGKGFAYVQFADENGVEAALLFDGQKFPPMLPRKLRVVRAKGMKRPPTNASKQSLKFGENGTAQSRGSESKQKATSDRTRQLLGRAAAAKMGKIQNAESLVFEGHRASAKEGTRGLKLGAGGKRRNRSTKRAAAWRAAGVKKGAKTTLNS